jgi:hypothetical protein
VINFFFSFFNQVNELHNLFTNKQTQILGPEGVIVENQFYNLPSNHNFNEDSSQSSSLVDYEPLSCKICEELIIYLFLKSFVIFLFFNFSSQAI